MQTRTYLRDCFSKGRLTRWPDKVMPLSVFIGKFNWYRSKGVSDEIKYTKMIEDALDIWQRLSGGVVSFKRTNKIYDSNINIEWRRVDRKSLGTCTF
ncbi:hypothetical protein IJ531_02935, partial [bacterium]|nr:hypothetical protein [bacterium]